MKKYYITILLFTLLFFTACEKKQTFSPNQSTNMTGTELLSQLIKFEKEHTDDFCSKVDLANYFITTGDYATSDDYLTRAESIINKCPSGKKGKEYKTLLYGMKAHILLYQGNPEQALKYADLAIEQDKKKNIHYNYIKGHIYLSQNNNSKALEIFDDTYQKVPDQLLAEDERAYMYLLADANRIEEAKNILEKYFENGTYFYGLGLFASSIYEELKDFDKSLLSAFLDYEYNSCFSDFDVHSFFDNLDKIVSTYSSAQDLFSIQHTVQFLKSIYDKSITVDYESDFFVADYIKYIKKIQDNTFNSFDVDGFLKLENNYSSFPSYYWNAWNGFINIDPTQKNTYAPLLNKIILLGANNYTKAARNELGKLAGLTGEDCSKILLAQEVDSLLSQYTMNNDTNLLIPIYELLSLPDNLYELNAVSIIKQYTYNVALRKELEKRIYDSDGRLKERLSYILL